MQGQADGGIGGVVRVRLGLDVEAGAEVGGAQRPDATRQAAHFLVGQRAVLEQHQAIAQQGGEPGALALGAGHEVGVVDAGGAVVVGPGTARRHGILPRLARAALMQPDGVEAADVTVGPGEDQVAVLERRRRGLFRHLEGHVEALAGHRMAAFVTGAVVAQPGQRKPGPVAVAPAKGQLSSGRRGLDERRSLGVGDQFAHGQDGACVGNRRIGHDRLLPCEGAHGGGWPVRRQTINLAPMAPFNLYVGYS